jgi:spore germination cell wall hydrolase CwlJ-like protein
MIITEDEKAVIRMTVKQEAADQPYLGKLAVAYVIVNRMKQQNKTAFEICWQPYQFSCWLNKLTVIALWLKTQPVSLNVEVINAVDQATSSSVADPTHGATHYLNKELTMRMNDGKLPGWVNALEETATIGQHTFYREKK